MNRPTTSAINRRWLAVLLATALLAAACSGGESGETADDEGGATAPAATDAADADGGGEQDFLAGDGDIPEFDLSGMEIRFTTSPAGGLINGSYWMFEKLEEWGATVDPIVITTTSGIQTMVAGESDAGAHGADEMILGSAEGAEAVAIGAPNSRLAYVLIGDEDVQSVEDLDGATIAMSGPSGFDALLSRLTLEDIGLDPDSDAQFLQIGGSGERAAALAAGSADAATVFLEDWFEIRQRAENLSLVDYMAERFPEFPAEAYFLNREYMEANPDMATAIACANLEYNSWIAGDPEGYVQWGLSIQDNATEQGLQDTYEAAQEVNIFPTDPDEVLSPEGMQALMEAMVETGDISQPVEIEQVYDDSYLTQAAEMGCGA